MTWQDWEDEGRLWAAVALQQLTGWKESTCYTLVGLKSRWHHIQAERRAMTRELWFKVLWLFNWTCLRCGTQNYRNQEPGKPKIEVDHIVSLFHFGLSILKNLQSLCSNCKRWKGIKDIDFRANWVNGRFVKRV
jgi:5-methylcytosine-specific restriction endonuclease McrA